MTPSSPSNTAWAREEAEKLARDLCVKGFDKNWTFEQFEPAIAKAVEQRLLAVERKAKEDAAQIAERYGCGRPGCTDCFAGAAAVAIRATLPPQHVEGERG